jgi:thioredoxin 2
MEKVQAGLQPICARCKTPLPDAAASDHPITVTDATFQEEVDRSPLPVLVDLWAPWCGPCRMLAPIIDNLAKELSGKLKVAKLNVDENPYTAERFDARGIPLLLFLKNGREVDRLAGLAPKAEIDRRVRQFIG